ncbi:MAG TPA: hypothetical protein VNT81_13590 [Vicinamibacterales bacterium]|nr:hypothetical protein [Vicinamibacterales bacterium]
MTSVLVGALLALAAATLGLRTTSLLISRVHPLVRLLVSLAIGAMFVATTLQISERYQVYDMGLGLLISLSPVGVFDLLKWWYRWQR